MCYILGRLFEYLRIIYSIISRYCISLSSQYYGLKYRTEGTDVCNHNRWKIQKNEEVDSAYNNDDWAEKRLACTVPYAHQAAAGSIGDN